MLLARRYRTLKFEELKTFPCDGLIIYAVRIVINVFPSSILELCLFECQSLFNFHSTCRFVFTQVETRSPGEDKTSGAPTGVSTATANPGTLPVKTEKTDSPPLPREVPPIRGPSPLPFLGHFPQNYVNVRPTRKLIARPQCSVCSKTFSRSGTLKVKLIFK